MLRKRKDGTVEDCCDQCGQVQSAAETARQAIARTTDRLGLGARRKDVLTCPECQKGAISD